MEQTAWPKLAVGLFTLVDVHPRNNNFNNLQRNQNKILSAPQNKDLILVICLVHFISKLIVSVRWVETIIRAMNEILTSSGDISRI